MSEIEKLYARAMVEPLLIIVRGVGEQIINYPPFTAERQLSLIKWLGKNKDGFGLFNDGVEGLSCHCDFDWEWFRKDSYAEDFNNALAGLINSLWQDLTDQERTEIKQILEAKDVTTNV